MNLDITTDERELLTKLLKKAEEFSVTLHSHLALELKSNPFLSEDDIYGILLNLPVREI